MSRGAEIQAVLKGGRRWRGGHGRADMRPETRDQPGGHETLRPLAGTAALVAVGDRVVSPKSQCLMSHPLVSRLRSLVNPAPMPKMPETNIF